MARAALYYIPGFQQIAELPPIKAIIAVLEALSKVVAISGGVQDANKAFPGSPAAAVVLGVIGGAATSFGAIFLLL